MAIADRLIRWFVGVLFIFSGLVKLNDPMGTAIKMQEYFEVFAGDISSVFHYLVPFAMSIGLFIIFLEILLGVAVLINYRMKLTSWILLVLIIFFTFLTFYSAAFDKVTDCGCFGDAIPLTPWQSFAKDIVLLLCIVYIFVRSIQFKPAFANKISVGILAAVMAFNVFVAYFAIAHLPPIDFRPYHIGADIQASMQPSEDFRYKYIMEKDGKEFDFENYPTDTTYKFVEMVLLNPDAEPKITDFNLWNESGDFTEEAFQGAKLLVLFNDVNKSKYKRIPQINALANEVKDEVEVWIVTANDEATYENFRHEYQIALPYYYADGTVIKAMIRANPGLMLIKDGIVMGKWHNNDVPSPEAIRSLIN